MIFRITYAHTQHSEIDAPTIEDAVKHARAVVAEFPKDEVKVLSIIAVELTGD
jgi:hypothetical protein